MLHISGSGLSIEHVSSFSVMSLFSLSSVIIFLPSTKYLLPFPSLFSLKGNVARSSICQVGPTWKSKHSAQILLQSHHLLVCICKKPFEQEIRQQPVLCVHWASAPSHSPSSCCWQKVFWFHLWFPCKPVLFIEHIWLSRLASETHRHK